jgi:hypothetical protein
MKTKNVTPPTGWRWMTHPDRNDGKPMPVRVYKADGTTFYQPFNFDAVDFEWSERDSDWKDAKPPTIRSTP